MKQQRRPIPWLFSVRLSQLILWLMIGISTHAQQRLFTNEQHFGVEDGLPQSYVTGIVQDDDGFIWLSTLDGFCRYDGRVFRTFRYNPKDSSGLASNTLNGLGKLHKNIITLYYSPTQAAEFNLRTFKTTPNNVRQQLARLPGIRWQSYRFGYDTYNWFFTTGESKGIGWINSITGKLTYANRANGKLKNDTVSAITQAPDGRIYLVNENGVQVSDTAQEKFEWIAFKTHLKHGYTSLEGDPFGEKFSIVSYPGNKVAMLEKDKLYLLDINRRSSKLITLPTPKPGAILGHNGLQVDALGRVYFEYYGRIYRLVDDEKLQLLWEHTGAPARISSTFIDRSDVLWLSLNAQGLLRMNLKALNFESYRYRGNFIAEMMAWIEPVPQKLPFEWDFPDAAYFFRQAWDSKGNLYSCNTWYQPAGVFQHGPKGFSRFKHLPEKKIFMAVVRMPGDAIWAFDQTEMCWYKWANMEAVPQKSSPDTAKLSGVELADARFIGGSIWMTTYSHGLVQHDGDKVIAKYAGKLGKHSIPTTLTEICVDPLNNNRFWIGSRGGGLLLWDAAKGFQRIYTMDDGLPNNTIYCILADKKGRVWCSTNRGIFRLDPTTNHIIAFEKTDGLQGNEFNRAHKYVLPDGRFVFGGLEGYTVFNPGDFEVVNKSEPVPILLTALQVNNKPQDLDVQGSIIRESLSTLSSIELPYDKNYLRFEFAAMLYNQPQKIRYRYQLEGADNDWIESGYSNVANYSALAPGDYTFRMNATDNNGLWSDTTREIKVTIRPPFWRTWWAYLIYSLIAFGLVRWYFIFREKRLQIQQNLAFEKREALRLREVDELKDRFFSNITHEFRTPLTLIMTPLEKLEQDPSLSTAAVNAVHTAQRNAKQLLRLINEFLDFSKLNDGQLKVKLSSGDLKIFVEEMLRLFEPAAAEKNIGLQLSTEGINGYYLFDEEKWERIINNLLSNALKFTPAGGKVQVSLAALQGEMVALTVQDNGPGIPANQQAKIFDRFFQVDDSATRNVGGTGIGLALVKELTELMQGNIRLKSAPGQTSFMVSLPLKKAVNNPVIHSPSADTIIHSTGASEQNDTPLLLIAEDNDELRSFLVETMQQQYRVLEAADGATAWDLILNELPEIVISDVMMPGRDGFDLCQLCKQDQRTAHIGFILLTSKAAHDARLRGLGTGADDYITKPFHLQELELRTANLLQLQQKQRAWLQAQLVNTPAQEESPVVTDPFLIQLYQEMDARLDDQELGVDYLARAMAMSRSTLNRKLKSLLDISTNDLIRQYRLQKATGLLRSVPDISTVAYQVGFSSPSYFTQCFKEKYGITPSDWLSSQN